MTDSPRQPRLRIAIDADAMFAGAASASGASHVILQLGELGIIEVRLPEQAMVEAERNLAAKIPAALPAFRRLVETCCTILPAGDAAVADAEADPKDAPILAAALAAECRWLVTFNTRDYRTERINVTAPGPFLEALRAALLELRD